MICAGFGNGGDDGDVVTFGADIVSTGDNGDVDVCIKLAGGCEKSGCNYKPFLRPT